MKADQSVCNVLGTSNAVNESSSSIRTVVQIVVCRTEYARLAKFVQNLIKLPLAVIQKFNNGSSALLFCRSDQDNAMDSDSSVILITYSQITSNNQLS